MRAEDHIPESAGQAVPLLHAPGAVMIEMVPAEIPEIRISEVVEMNGMVDPFLSDVTCHNPRQENRQRVDWRDEAQRGREKKERKQVSQLAVDVTAVVRSAVMLPVKGI